MYQYENLPRILVLVSVKNEKLNPKIIIPTKSESYHNHKTCQDNCNIIFSYHIAQPS